MTLETLHDLPGTKLTVLKVKNVLADFKDIFTCSEYICITYYVSTPLKTNCSNKETQSSISLYQQNNID